MKTYATDQRKTALEIAREMGVVTPKLLQEQLECSSSTASLILSRMAEIDLLKKVSRGMYVIGASAADLD